ncbi:hypothetical protein COU78_06155 [Candidatus Peregrinibacteria bacterium CG10_big_fil_rev_8_21_14_0_10_49_24]|nr:MAG: hypothetical protein COV83_02990 [Candidatus Peregrinibacteria bacterium CG11_big_fil_rev_8_21_14_0_20_49_14]PIR50438.1 MAG: hypothetical protein COU78_06155 [Candidatus Peregrinibacteria bacterium CG10_big_fil_rev_8_21_14_0_10_49_24]PJA68274.1 MAG: hypothetical protein CO157_00145 [Candidatus Peregrinibacteria bacterium CG_4_9_14_3_um_filter_49_12]
MRSTFDKRLVIIGIISAVIAVHFWAGSRIPQLNEKASMGTEMSMNALGFSTVLEVQPSDSWAKEIAYTSINWAQTNKKGMTFGVLFATCLMTIFSLLRKRGTKGRFSNSFLGFCIGAPLSVCVNCAAPMAQGLSARGAKMETTLAVMMTSPTMNFIVLTMLFSLFPPYLIGIKIVFTVVFILVGIPLLSRFVLQKESEKAQDCELPASLMQSCPADTAHTPEGEKAATHWFPALLWTVKELCKNLWFIFRTTVPLMLAAGILGATMITLLPWDSIVELLPNGGILSTVIAMVALAAVGTFLPVPISFDVLTCAVLLAAGMPPHYVAVLLFTLGIYSVYSFMIVWQAISPKTAITLFLSVTLLGVAAGCSGYVLHQRVIAKNMAQISLLLSEETDEKMQPAPRMESSVPIPRELPTEEVLRPFAIQTASGISVLISPLATRSAPAKTLFTKVPASSVGLDEPYIFSFLRMNFPFEQGYGRAIATGDIHNDGWADVLFTSEAGLSLYANYDGHFEKQEINVPEMKQHIITNAALVDVNNDNWLDIFYTTLTKGSHIIFNNHGVFQSEGYRPVTEDNVSIMTTAMGFGDLDNNGFIDVVLGKWDWSLDGVTKTSANSEIRLLMNDGDIFRSVQLLAAPVNPTSILITDFDADGYRDIIVGNDLSSPDLYYLGKGNGEFSVINHKQKLISNTTSHTMSVAGADINNDLTQEILLANIARYEDHDHASPSYEEACELLKNEEKLSCKRDYLLQETFSLAKKNEDVSVCMKIEDKSYRKQCILYYYVREKNCEKIPTSWEESSFVCNALKKEASRHFKNPIFNFSIPQTVKKNVLLVRNGSGGFTDMAEEYGVDKAGWAWNMQFADMNNDEWQDIFTVNGSTIAVKIRESNYAFINQRGENFVNATQELGLTSHSTTNSYSYMDIDNDGDLDIVTIPINAPIEVYMNNENDNNAIAVELRDSKGNSFGVGSLISLYYTDGTAPHQLREIVASGGKGSFHAPVGFFGLGKSTKVDRMEIVWPDGIRTVLSGEFMAGNRYRIEREN